MDSFHFAHICEEAYAPFSSILFLSDSLWFSDFMALNLLVTDAQCSLPRGPGTWELNIRNQEWLSFPALGSSEGDLIQKLEMLVFSVLELNDWVSSLKGFCFVLFLPFSKPLELKVVMQAASVAWVFSLSQVPLWADPEYGGQKEGGFSVWTQPVSHALGTALGKLCKGCKPLNPKSPGCHSLGD